MKLMAPSRAASSVRRLFSLMANRSGVLIVLSRSIVGSPSGDSDAMTTALSHLRYLVSEFTPVLHFYRDVLRLKLAVDVPGVYAEFETPGGRLAFYRADLMAEVLGAPVATHIGDDCVLCLRVENVDAAAARVKLAGNALLTAPHDRTEWSQRVAHLKDPAGHLVELWSPLPRPPELA